MSWRRLGTQLVAIIFISIMLWDYRNELGTASHGKFFGISVILGCFLAELELIAYYLKQQVDPDEED